MHELRLDIPRKQDPGILANLGNKGIDQRASCWLGIDCCEVRLRQHLADLLCRAAGIHQIVDDEPVRAVALNPLQDLQFALHTIVIGGEADGIDQPDLQLTRDNGRRH